MSVEMGELGEEADDEALGALIGRLMGFSFEDEEETQIPTGISDTSRVGIGPADIERIGDDLAPGTAAALFLVEHRWAAGVRDAVLEASATIEIAAEVEAAVVARTIRTLLEAGYIEQAAADQAARVVVSAALIEEAIEAGADS